MNALSHITVLPSSKEEISTFSKQVIAEVECGNIDPLALKVRLKWLEKLIDAIDKPIKDSAMKEAAKYGKKFEYKNFIIEEMESGTSYDYSQDAICVELEAKLKERKEFLKALKSPIDVVDSDGVVTTIAPPIKKSTTTLKFTAK